MINDLSLNINDLSLNINDLSLMINHLSLMKNHLSLKKNLLSLKRIAEQDLLFWDFLTESYECRTGTCQFLRAEMLV